MIFIDFQKDFCGVSPRRVGIWWWGFGVHFQGDLADLTAIVLSKSSPCKSVAGFCLVEPEKRQTIRTPTVSRMFAYR